MARRIQSEYDTLRPCQLDLARLRYKTWTAYLTPSKLRPQDYTECEAVAQGLAAIRRNEWVAGIAQGSNVVNMSVADVRVEREIKLGDFTKWLDRTGGSPREVRDRHPVRLILGMTVSR